jgi:hypothetical protein
MSLPGFAAEAALTRSNRFYAMAPVRVGSAGSVVPQDCGFWKGLGCALGPISWCALASLGGPRAFCECVAGASNGNCIDCTACGGSGLGLDPRAKDADAVTGKVAGGQFGLTIDSTTGGVTVGPPPSLGQRSPDLVELARQLNRIERCACGLNLDMNSRVSSLRVRQRGKPRQRWAVSGILYEPSHRF